MTLPKYLAQSDVLRNCELPPLLLPRGAAGAVGGEGTYTWVPCCATKNHAPMREGKWKLFFSRKLAEKETKA